MTQHAIMAIASKLPQLEPILAPPDADSAVQGEELKPLKELARQ